MFGYTERTSQIVDRKEVNLRIPNMHILYHTKYHHNITKLRTSGGLQAPQSSPIIFPIPRPKISSPVWLRTRNTLMYRARLSDYFMVTQFELYLSFFRIKYSMKNKISFLVKNSKTKKPVSMCHTV